MTVETNSNITGVGSVSGGGLMVAGVAPFQPWKIATFGDSRSNTSSTQPDVSQSQGITDIRTATHMVGLLGDAEITRNYGLSGSLAHDWADPARAAAKTINDLSKSDVDLVHVQMGINDAMALDTSANIAGYLKALCTEILKSGKLLLLESTQPVIAPATNATAAQAIVDDVNTQMASWIANFPTVARFADTASVLKLNGFANPAYQNSDGIHLLRVGAAVGGAVCATKARELLPKRVGLYPSWNRLFPNFLNPVAPYAFLNFETGTGINTAISTGLDSGGYFTQVNFTPDTFASGECRARIDLAANFLNSVNPFFSLNGAEILKGSARIVVDDGNGGTPNCYNVSLRQRFYTAAVFRDTGLIPPGAPDANTRELSGPMDEVLITPSVANTAASVSAAPAAGAGWVLQVFVGCRNQGTPIRVKIYNAQLRPVGYKSTPVAGSLPASGLAYTNVSPVSQMVICSGGTVSQLAVNGVNTGLTAGQFLLRPGDTWTPTYTVVPAMLVQYLAS